MTPTLLGVLLGAATSVAPAAAAAAAAPGVIYRCTAPDGAVALQDDPCPRGYAQETRTIAIFGPPGPPTVAPAETPAVAVDGASATSGPPADAAPASSATTVEAASIEAAATPPARPLVMPPPLWRCTDLDGASRFADAYDPRPRCVPLSVLGVDLSRAPPSAAGLCRTVEDDCVELGGDAACAAWAERLAAAESALRHAFSSEAAERRAERDRAKAVVDGDCRP